MIQAARVRIPEPSPTPDTAATPELVHVRPYLSAEQLCELTPWTPDALEKLVRRGVLKRGVHYFQPLGRRSRLFFKWSAVEAFIEGRPVCESEPVVDKPRPALKAIPTRAKIDVEKATTDLQRLLS